MTTEITKKTTSYDLVQQAGVLLSMLADADGDEQIDLAEKALHDWLEASGEKMLAIKAVRTRALVEVAFLKEQAGLFLAGAKRREAKADALDGLAMMLLHASSETSGTNGVTLSDGTMVKLATRKSDAVIIDDLALIPPVYTKIEVVPVKDAIKAAIKAQLDVPGAHVENRESVSVKWGK